MQNLNSGRFASSLAVAVCVRWLPVALLLGCGESRTKLNNQRIDPEKIIDLKQPSLFSLRITIFIYQHADTKGWPIGVLEQRYVRFLQDRNIPVGFNYDRISNTHQAMVNAADAPNVTQADKEAINQGVAKPPLGATIK